ncbi:alpha/beta fold hydrolase [Phycicoccus sonneratiae]|uniref:Alpha/beta hydrolase n=1 Tax=Phycicoccus sonneratiae TaxID=2807628 RepID=A0ABS2CHE1_9MICO|nr:alpha/beta hydrolase [Phycicoccus sonneraticus]MBM6399288.1 alpha/beta hydrolase [Phycicoccus sonneraticus]
MPLTDTGIEYDRDGPRGGVPVLLLHAGVADRRMWDGLWDSLIRTHDVVRADLRGFGGSDRLPDGPLSHRADVLALLDELAVDRCDIVAASMGSGVAAEVAVVAPDRVRSLALCPPGGSLLVTMTPELRAFADAERSALAAGDLDAAVAANVDTWVVGPGRSADDVDAGLREAVARMQRRAFEVGAAFDDVEEDELDPPVPDRLDELTAPVLVLLGGFDLDTTRDATERLLAGLPRARRVDWPDAAHLPSMEHPERFTDLLLDWLARPLT